MRLIIADSTRNVLVNVMGFRPEVDDSDGIYDIYIDQRCNGCYELILPILQMEMVLI